MSAKDRANLNIFAIALFIIWQMTQSIVLILQYFYLWRNKCSFFFVKPETNLGNQYRKDAT